MKQWINHPEHISTNILIQITTPKFHGHDISLLFLDASSPAALNDEEQYMATSPTITASSDLVPLPPCTTTDNHHEGGRYRRVEDVVLKNINTGACSNVDFVRVCRSQQRAKDLYPRHCQGQPYLTFCRLRQSKNIHMQSSPSSFVGIVLL